MTTSTSARVDEFRSLHRKGDPLLLANPWDFASAAALAAQGFRALGTTSLGVAAAAGKPDGTGATRAETVALARRLTQLDALISADIEGQVAADPAEVAALAADLAAAGVVGVNLEDGRPDGTLTPAKEHAAAVAAVKEAGETAAGDLFVNARVDTWWASGARPPTLDETLERARAYVDAGADGVFVPGVTDPDDIAALTGALDVPLNVLLTADQQPLARLAEPGVARVSFGSLLFRAALGHAVFLASAIRGGAPVPGGIPSYGEVQALAGR